MPHEDPLARIADHGAPVRGPRTLALGAHAQLRDHRVCNIEHLSFSLFLIDAVRSVRSRLGANVPSNECKLIRGAF